MKKIVGLLPLFLLAGCLNISQYVELKSPESGVVKLKMTVAKTGDEENNFMDEKSLSDEDFLKSFRSHPNVKYTKIDSEAESGFLLEAPYNDNTSRELGREGLFPLVEQDKIIIRFPSSKETMKDQPMDENTRQMMTMMLSSAKYSLIVKPWKGVQVFSARYHLADSNITVIPVKIGDTYHVELPLSYWLLSSMDGYLVLNLNDYTEPKTAKYSTSKPDIKATTPTANYYNQVGLNMYRKGRFSDAYQNFKKAYDLDPQHKHASYNLACVFALTGQPAGAVYYLKIASQVKQKYSMSKWELRKKIINDPDFDSIREDYRFLQFMASLNE